MTSYDTITDGTNTVTFKSINGLQETVDLVGVKINPYPQDGKQQILDVGRRGEIYVLDFSLVDISGGDSAYTQLQTLKTIWKNKHQQNEFLRKITFAKPGTVIYGSYTPMTKTVYGYIQTITHYYESTNSPDIEGELVLIESLYKKFEE
ncbi:MAG TPA: hypothetical protein VKN14_02305 [Flavobacteriaceae bacterium]|nr:hypothetical protein [Flavobacteriaceae bacterium]